MEHTNDIFLKGKTTSTYEAENQAFLAKYDTDDKQIDYYTDKAMKIFEEFEIDGSFTFDGVRKSISVWYANKKPQMELFRKHPYWSEEAKAIVFLQTETRAINYRDAAEALSTLYCYARNHYWDYSNPFISAVWATLREYRGEQTTLLTPEFIEHLKHNLGSGAEIHKKVQALIKPGTKITKLVRKGFEYSMNGDKVVNATTLVSSGDPRTRKSFDKYYAKFADHLSELTVEKITCASLHFCDFMTMSNGNSWSSCHFINSNGIFHDSSDSSYRGRYKQGCLSYALDAPSFLLYTLPASYEGNEYYRVQKLNRMCCQYKQGVLITGKCYPDNSDELIKRYRQIMQLIISQVEECPNLWSFSKKIEKIRAFVTTASHSAHYRDYEMSAQKPTISLCKSMVVDIDDTMTIGHEAYCLHCGDIIDDCDQEWLQCDHHRIKLVCNHCGKRFKDGDEYYEVGGYVYCSEHVFYCEYHNCFEPISEHYGEILTRDGTIVVCEDALNDLVKCGDCGLYYPKSETKQHEKIHYCIKCYDKFPKCRICGGITTGGEICEHCLAIKKSGLIITPTRIYQEGDYVLIRDNIKSCPHGCNDDMEGSYPNRIVKIERVNSSFSDTYHVSRLGYGYWSWSARCFAGIVENGCDAYIGKTVEEISKMVEESRYYEV